MGTDIGRKKYSNIDKIYDYVVLQTTDQYALKITVSLELKPPKTKQNGLRSTDNMHHDVTQYFVVVFILIIEKKDISMRVFSFNKC